MADRRTWLVRVVAPVALAGLPCATKSACAWGLVGHRLVVERAVGALGAGSAQAGPLAALARSEVARLKERSLDPDLIWRDECGRAEGILHFFDVDVYGGDPARVDRDLDRLRASHGARAVDDAGLLPWRIAEMAGCLRDAMARGDRDWTLQLMGQLAHYTADLAMPFHLTRNFDGQQTGQNGVHFRYEDGLVGRRARRLGPVLAALPIEARAASDPLEAAFAAMAGWEGRVARVLAADREAAARATLEGRVYYRELGRRLEGALAEDLARGAALTAAVWLWAWEQAGRPDLAPATAAGGRRRKDDRRGPGPPASAPPGSGRSERW